jgi:long-subunit acyl-CoA synthetase (AMP-forming)
MISHKNVLAFIRCFTTHPDFGIHENDVYPSYLPLPHVMERCVVLGMLGFGVHVMYHFINKDARADIC